MAEQWNVGTSDRRTIAVWIEGDGQPLVLVHGSISDHAAFDPLVTELRSEFTVFAMDRRGFGANPDGPGYSADREFSDVAMVANAVGARIGAPVVLFGHSWGASCALGAASLLLPSVRALILYEPSLGLRSPPGLLDRIEERPAAGDDEGAVIEVLGSAGMTEDEIAERQAAPNWPDRVATRPHDRPGVTHRGRLGVAASAVRRPWITDLVAHWIGDHWWRSSWFG